MTRCAPASLARNDPLHGTASTVQAFLVVQQEGAWGVDALRQSGLPRTVADWLDRGRRDHGVRPLLARRHARADAGGVHVFAAWAHPRAPWLGAAVLDRVEDLPDLVDLAALGRGQPCGLPPTDQSVFLACTHGSHDACCALEGRTVAAGLADSHPGQSWEVSHIGGDRFAGNLLVLPQGLYYGRVDATSGPRIATAHLAGDLDLDHLRGRAGHAFAVQAAEHHLRRHLDLVAIDAVRLRGRARTDEGLVATFATPDGTWEVVVATHRGPPAHLTCRAAADDRPLVTALVDLRPVATA